MQKHRASMEALCCDEAENDNSAYIGQHHMKDQLNQDGEVLDKELVDFAVIEVFVGADFL